MKVLTLLRASVIGLALCATAVPAQAQMGFGFGFGFGNGFGGYYDRDNGYGYRYRDRQHRRPFVCVELSDRQIRRAVARQGYRNISLYAGDSRRITVRASRNGRAYLLRVSTCTGSILDRQRIRRYS